MPDPTIPAGWQKAVDTARFILILETAKLVGLLSSDAEVDQERCEEILRCGRELGYEPAPTSSLIKQFLEVA